MRCPKRHQTGFTVVELIVAMAVLAIGIAGAVATQATAKRNSVDAGQRSTAMYMAHDIMERMRLNKTLIDSYQGSDYGTAAFSVESTKNCLSTTPCTPAELVVYDTLQWHWLLKKGQVSLTSEESTVGLLKPTGCIQTVGGEVTVVISWLSRESTVDAAASDNDNKTDFEKACGDAGDKRRQVSYTSYMF